MSANHIPAPEKKLYDWASILLYLGIVLFGWLNIYAACYDEAHASVFDFSRQHGKQILWMASAFLIAVCILLIHPRVFSNGSYIIYGIVLLLLVATLFIGTVTNGGQSWIDFGAFKFQPSEFAKFATALALSKYISAIDIDLTLLRTRATLALMVLVPAGLILLQHDTGSALVFLAFLLPFFREGLSHYILLIGLLAIILFVSALLINKYLLMGILLAICLFYLFVWLSKRTSRNYWHTVAFFIVCCLFTLSVEFTFEHVLETHQRNRIYVLLGKVEDPRGVGYNVDQAKIAIGAGGLVITMAERQRSTFSRFYGYCVASILFFHFAINIGMVLGLVPVIGIPLPFFSYGGSSLIAFTILLFIFIRQDADRNALI